MATLLAASVMAACGGGQAAKSPGEMPAATKSATAAVRAVPPGTGSPEHTQPAPSAASAGCGAPHESGRMTEQAETPEGTRSYLLYVPASYDPQRATPAVLSFHGYAQDAAQQEAYSGLNTIADREGFLVVTPEGSGSPPGWSIPGTDEDTGFDDVAFVEALIEHLGATLCLDTHRIYATGHSNGGEMASQIACRLPELIAAIAPVSGAIFQGCDGPGVPVIAFQGAADYNVPYEDSAAGVEGWVAHNGCPAEPEVTRPTEHVRLESWECDEGDVSFYVVTGGGHTWPGADPALGGVGPTTSEIDASELMWTFFTSHPKAGP